MSGEDKPPDNRLEPEPLNAASCTNIRFVHALTKKRAAKFGQLVALDR